MKPTISFILLTLFCFHPLHSSWQNFWHPLVWWYNRLSSDVKEIITHAANVDETDQACTAFAQALSDALDKNPDDIARGSLLLRIYKHCYQRKKENAHGSEKKSAMAHALIKVALEKGANPNTCGRKEKNIILKAHAYNDPVLMNMLVEYNANLMVHDKNGDYIFHTQVKNNNKEMVAVYLNQKDIAANINIQDNHCQTALIMATKTGSKEMVRLLLEHDAHPDLSDQSNSSPLLIAAKQGFTDIAQLLLDYNANPNLSDQNTTPLHTAIEQNNIALVNQLIVHNATINIFDADGNSTLFIACKQNNNDIIHLLLKHGADAVINKGNKYGEYPLFVIMRHAFKQKGDAHHTSLAMIKTMLAHGADTRLKDGSGNTLFTLACRYNALDVMDILKEHDSGLIDEPDKNGNTPLHNEAIAGSYDTVQYLIHYGAKVNKPNTLGQTPLLCAMEKGQSDVATLLLASGANINHIDKNGNTVWHCLAFANGAAINCNPIIIQSALPLLNKKNNDGNTPLHIATFNNNTHLIPFLLAQGARIDITNNASQTVLHIAAQKSCEILKLLLETNGAQQLINAQDQNGNTALHNAAAAGNIKCLQLLLNMQAMVDVKNNDGATPFILSCQKLQMATIRTFLNSNRVNPNKADTKGYTGIHYVAEKGNVSALRELVTLIKQVKNNPNYIIDKPTKLEKFTALHIATRCQYVECVALLIEAGANVNACDKDGNTPLHFACSTNPQICKLLLNCRDIKPNLANDKSLRPLHVAIEKGADRCIDVLMQHKEINPNGEDDAQRTPLYYAFHSSHPVEYTQKLLQHKNIKPDYLKPDESSLHAAFDKKDFELLTLLLSHDKITFDAINHDKQTIWDRALYSNQLSKMIDILCAIRDSGEIRLSHRAKIENKINELEKLKNPPPTNPEYTQNIPAPLYPIVVPVPTAPPAQDEDTQQMPPPVNPEWDGKEYSDKSFDTSYSAKAS